MIFLGGLFLALAAPVMLTAWRGAQASGLLPVAVAAGWFLLAGAAAIRAWVRQCPAELDWRTAALLVLPTAGILQLMAHTTQHRAATGDEVVIWLALAALFVAARSILSDLNIRRLFLDATLLLGVVVALASMAGWSPFPNRNHLGAFTELILPLAMVRAAQERRPVFYFAASILAAAVVLGGSRAAIALMAAEALALIWLLGEHSWRARGLTLGIALAVLAVAGVALWPQMAERGDGDRRAIYASTLALIADRPLTGSGLGSYETAYPAHARFDNGLIVDHAHNDWLEWMAEAGVPAVLPILLLALWSAREAWRQPWALGVPAVFLHALVDYPFHKPALAAWVLVLVAAMIAGRRSLAWVHGPPGERATTVPPESMPTSVPVLARHSVIEQTAALTHLSSAVPLPTVVLEHLPPVVDHPEPVLEAAPPPALHRTHERRVREAPARQADTGPSAATATADAPVDRPVRRECRHPRVRGARPRV